MPLKVTIAIQRLADTMTHPALRLFLTLIALSISNVAQANDAKGTDHRPSDASDQMCSSLTGNPEADFKRWGAAMGDCTLHLARYGLPTRARLDTKIDSLAIGISNFRSDGPRFTPGHAVNAMLFHSLVGQMRIDAARSRQYTNGQLSVDGGEIRIVVSVPRRNDPTGLLKTLDAVLSGMQPGEERGSAWGGATVRIWNPGTDRARSDFWVDRLRITKRVVIDRIEQQIKAVSEGGVRAALLYLSTYHYSDESGEALLWASDSIKGKRETFLSVYDILTHYADAAKAYPDTQFFVIIDGLHTTQTASPAVAVPQPRNLLFADLPGGGPSPDAFWFTGKSPPPPAVAASGVDLTRLYRMSAFPAALKARLKWCEINDTGRDEMPGVMLKDWIVEAWQWSVGQNPHRVEAAVDARVSLSNSPPRIYCPNVKDDR